MCNKAITYLGLVCFLFTNVARGAADDAAATPQELISRARLLEQLWTDGTPPMTMRADLEVSDPRGGQVQGQYIFNWVSTSRWREEIRFANYARIRVREAKGYWQDTGLNYQPEVIFQLDTLLQVKTAFKVGSKQTLGRIKSREKDKVRQKCTEVKWAAGTERVMCFDEVNGALLSVEYPRGDSQNPPEISRIEYGEFKAVAGKLVPYEIRAWKDRKIVASVKILEIAAESEAAHTESFNASGKAEFWPQCDDMQEVESVDRQQPIYPASARRNREQGRVVLYGVVEADGSLSHLTVIHHAIPDLESAAIEAVRHWRYKAARCDGTPIRLETSIATDFWLQP